MIEDNDSACYAVYPKTESSKCTAYSIYLDGLSDETLDYSELLNFLRTAKSHWTIDLYTTCSGGSIIIGLDIIEALLNCEAKTVAHVTSSSYSMGSLIALSAAELRLRDTAFMHFHDASAQYSSLTKMQQLVNIVVHEHLQYKNLLWKLAHPFLTASELSDIIEGKELFLHGYLEQDRVALHNNRRNNHAN